MTLNKEVFAEDPSKKSIPNLGVAKVGEPADEAGWSVLRYELSSFVCDGAYEQGLDRILSAYVAQAGAEQPAVWVSGFYGSGKSHLVRVLEYLWRDLELPDGSRARGLVRVTTAVEDALRELSTVGARNGGLWSAAGTLGAGAGSVRLAFLSIMFAAAGLPTEIAPARCVMWLQDEGLLDQVQADIAQRGLDWEMELDNMYVSQLGEAILAARPGWAASADMAREQIHNQFPQPDDVSLSETIKIIDKVLRLVSNREGKLPCALVVLDEMQQFINEDPERAQQVQLLVEACSSSFDGLLMIVATGQAALQTTAVLQKLIDRFAIQVQLSDTDVDAVIREVVLRKKPEKIGEVTSVLDGHAGEIDRQLAGAKIAPIPADQTFLVADYPLLPARRRFWEHVLRSVDKAGKAGQLRSQLRVVHEANRTVAQAALGTVVPADFIYDEKSADMLQTGVLLREIEQLIKGERENGPDGALRSRVLALVFLISQLSREGFADTGVRATESHIADLMVDDLGSAGAALRRDVPRVLAELHGEAKLLKVDDEYLLQTQAGQEWTKEFRNRRIAFLSDVTRVASAREEAFRTAVSQVAPRARQQGISRTNRTVDLHFGDVQPRVETGIPLWIRNGWDLSEKQFQDLAAGAGADSPVVMIYLPKVDADALSNALADLAAADETLAGRPRPNTDEGLAAQRAMESTRDVARDKLSGHVADVLRSALVVQAGGTVVKETDIGRAIATAVDRSIDRLYPKFSDADHAGWGTAWTRALQGNENCLESVGHKGSVVQHPVCKALLASVSPVGTSGADLRKKFEAPEYGWPRDAIHAGLAALVLASDLNAEENGSPVTVAQFKPNSMGKLVFRRETAAVPLPVRLAVQQVLSEANVSFEKNEVAVACASLLQRLEDLAAQAGGPAPLPVPPTSDVVSGLKGLKGNELILAINDRRDQIRDALKKWNGLSSLKQGRLDAFTMAKRLVKQLPEGKNAQGPRSQLEAIEEHRQLLDQPDPISPVVSAAADVLRGEIQGLVDRYNEAVRRALDSVSADANWQALDEDQRRDLLTRHELVELSSPPLGTPDEVLRAVESRPLSSWGDRVAAVEVRVGQVRETAAKILEPAAYRTRVPAATLKTPQDVDAYVDDLRKQLMDELAAHKSLII